MPDFRLNESIGTSIVPASTTNRPLTDFVNGLFVFMEKASQG